MTTPDNTAGTIADRMAGADIEADLLAILQAVPEPVAEEAAHSVLGRVFQGVLFDMDGTLVDSTKAVNRSWQQWADEMGFGALFSGVQHGRPGREMIADLVAPELVDSSFARVNELELSDTDDISILPGAAELMNSIPEGRRAIVTSCPSLLCRARLASAGFVAPATVVTVEDTVKGKPAPDPFLEAADRLGLDARQCIVIEDAPAGLAAGRAAGCATIGVVGTHTADELDADLVVTSLDRLRIELHDHGVVFSISPES
ncbi:HAD-IA family hydrolase [Cryobacterium sp. 1639]|uniref:HAD-IA family hydrolase n=1 Tax=Cryobacterium inferilacus TaxID=2866629 RepID=UPI001C736D29|nr:HAD-IA family hydrolase [Cryobacterium sp. 1639]MBX0299735.1 HAD-IA family hydrolase [Cryobacterium sp. 1639]